MCLVARQHPTNSYTCTHVYSFTLHSLSLLCVVAFLSYHIQDNFPFLLDAPKYIVYTRTICGPCVSAVGGM